ncbi:hypothetical protein B0T20DRAFT_347814 [Sordaria brevicollis]|uniref:Uncharacterized protein n=1 Tax=Sordaria brevicollis TaxID=83679 RepID=A0AAE0PIV1_SORBR|nr:hypothetical protein B0T20DRAFT_347814 [Sordaria brevicollis]
MAAGKDDKLEPVPHQGVTDTPRKVHWVVYPPSQELGHTVGTDQLIRYFGVIEVNPVPMLPTYKKVSAIATIYKIGPDGRGNKQSDRSFSYDQRNPGLRFSANLPDTSCPYDDFIRFILFGHIRFPEAGTYKLDVTVEGSYSSEVYGPTPRNLENIGKITGLHIKVKDDARWDEQRTDWAGTQILAHLEWYPVVGCDGYMDKQTREIMWEQPIYCANPRRTEKAKLNHAQSDAGLSSLITVIYTGGPLPGSGSVTPSATGSGSQVEVTRLG